MTDDQLAILAASCIMAGGQAGIESALATSRKLILMNRKLGPIKDHEIQKATLSKPSVEDWNESHEARQYEKRRGT